MKTFTKYFLGVLFLNIILLAQASNLSFTEELQKRDLLVNNINLAFKTELNKIYPGYKVYSYCDGSFKQDGGFEYALGIINPLTKEARYVVAFYDNDNQDKLSAITILSSKLTDESIKLKLGLSVSCESPMGIKRLNQIVGNPDEAIHGQIAPINSFDSFCITEPNLDTDHTCYSYDHKQNKFISIGGWIT